MLPGGFRKGGRERRETSQGEDGSFNESAACDLYGMASFRVPAEDRGNTPDRVESETTCEPDQEDPRGFSSAEDLSRMTLSGSVSEKGREEKGRNLPGQASSSGRLRQ